MLLVLEVIVIVMYGLFLRPYIKGSTPVATDNANYYPMYQDINVMMLIGFGFMYAFGKTGSWSSVSYVFFINAIIIQLYFILQPFWLRVFNTNFLNQNIQASEKMFSMASYAVCSVLVSFGAVLGRVGPLELLIMGVIHVISYTLN
jgi:ammonium transporter Rh